MAQTKNNIPQIRFKGFYDEWENVGFKDITKPTGIKNKDNLPLESYSISNEFGFISQNEQFENGGTMKIADKTMYYIVSPKSFAYNPARINIGSIGYYDLKNDVIVSSLYEVFKTDENCDDSFFWFWFKSEKFKKLIEKFQEGGVRLYFYYDKLCKCTIYRPSLPEQTAIGTFFQTLDTLIATRQKKLKSLKNLKKACLVKMFPQNGSKVPEIRFKGFSGEWEEKKLGEIFDIGNGYTPSKSNLKYWTGGDIPWFRMDDIRKNGRILKDSIQHVTREAIKSSGLFPAWSFIMSTTATIGEHALLIADSLANQQFSFLIKKLNRWDDMDKMFMFYYMYHLGDWCKKNTNAGGLNAVNMREFISYIFLIPCNIEEQIAIANYFQNLDKLISTQEQEIEKLQNLKKACLDKMFV